MEIFIAVETHDMVNVKRLIDLNSDCLHSMDPRGMTPLYYASCPHMIKLLLSHGADANVKENIHQWSILSSFVSRSLETFKLLVESGADINAKDKYGFSVLRDACEADCIQIVQYLLDNGIDIQNDEVKVGLSPIWAACYNENIEIIKLLMYYGANPYRTNKDGYSAMVEITEDIDIIPIIKQHYQLYRLKEWRPWNHTKYPVDYQQAMQTLVQLAKAQK